jgi:hypothetical protein
MRDYSRRIVLGFSFQIDDGKADEAFEAPRGFEIEPLRPVSLEEMTLHLETFKEFYRISSAAAPETATNLLEPNQHLFQPIHRELEVKAEMIRWTEREKNKGGNDA